MSSEAEMLPAWVEKYYADIVRKSTLNGVDFSYYKSLRGYFKHSSLLTDLKQQEFGLVDYRIWEMILTKIKSSRNAVESGGLFFRYSDYKDVCGKSSFYKTKSKFIKLELLVKTPFRDYFILNPRFVIKLYNPKPPKKEESPKG